MSENEDKGIISRAIGMIALVAGTTIGGGMLAMPLTSAGIGFEYSVVLLIILWFVLTLSALYFVELYQFTSPSKGLSALAEQYFGAIGKIIITVVLFLFLYAITTAYILGGSQIVSNQFGFSTTISSLLFILVFGIPVVLGTKIVDNVNKILFFIMLVALFTLLVILLPEVKGVNLLALPVDYLLLLSAAPVFFTAFGFHVVIPNVSEYLNGKTKVIKFVMYAGTLIPLVVYIAWQLAIHGIIGQDEFIAAVSKDATIVGLAKAVGESYGPIFETSVKLFSALALVTSFIGVSLGMISLFNDLTAKSSNELIKNPIANFVFMYTIPLAIALYYIQGFLYIIAYAGVLFAIYVIVLPVACILKCRVINAQEYKENNLYKVSGGTILVILLLLVGIAITFIPNLMSLGYLPSVKG